MCVCIWATKREEATEWGGPYIYQQCVCVWRESSVHAHSRRRSVGQQARSCSIHALSLSLSIWLWVCVFVFTQHFVRVPFAYSSFFFSYFPHRTSEGVGGCVHPAFPPYNCVCLKKPFVSECCCLCSFFLFYSILLHGVLSKGKRVPPGVSCVCVWFVSVVVFLIFFFFFVRDKRAQPVTVSIRRWRRRRRQRRLSLSERWKLRGYRLNNEAKRNVKLNTVVS